MNLTNKSFSFIFLIVFLVIILIYYNKFLINYGPVLAKNTKTISYITSTASKVTTRIEENDHTEKIKKH